MIIARGLGGDTNQSKIVPGPGSSQEGMLFAVASQRSTCSVKNHNKSGDTNESF